MSEKLIGVAVGGNNADEVLARIERSERAGIPAAWMTTGEARMDSITVMAAAAGRTQKIKFGTSVVPTFPPQQFGGPTLPFYQRMLIPRFPT